MLMSYIQLPPPGGKALGFKGWMGFIKQAHFQNAKKNLAAAAHMLRTTDNIRRFRQHGQVQFTSPTGQPQAQRRWRIQRSRLCCRRHAECPVTFLCTVTNSLVPSMKHAKCAYRTATRLARRDEQFGH